MADQTKRNTYQILQPLLLATMVALGIILGKKIEQSGTPETEVKVRNITSVDKSNNAVEEANRFIEARYIDSVSVNELNDRVIKNMVHSLDPFSSYLPTNKSIEYPFSDFLQAYGFTAKKIQDKWMISELLPGSDAWLSSVEIGDQIIKINNVNQGSLSFSSWSDTVLHLDLKQKNEEKKVAIFRRDLGTFKSVPMANLIQEQIGYIKIIHFGDNTYDEFITALDSLYAKKGARHFILDLRDNSGGYMEECSRILNQLFKEKNILLASTHGRTVRKIEYKTDGRQLHDIQKIAVLINNKSASASEVFAGAIQDLDRGKVIGSPSYGKGLVQEQYMLSNGAALRLSVARFYLPSGRTVDQTGKNTDLTKKYFSKNKNLLKTGNSIIPDVPIQNIPAPKLNPEDENKILEYVLNQKKIINGYSKTDPVKSIYRQLLNSKKKWSPEYKADLLQSIIKTWGKAHKDHKSMLDYHLLPQPEIQAALKFLK